PRRENLAGTILRALATQALVRIHIVVVRVAVLLEFLLLLHKALHAQPEMAVDLSLQCFHQPKHLVQNVPGDLEPTKAAQPPASHRHWASTRGVEDGGVTKRV